MEEVKCSKVGVNTTIERSGNDFKRALNQLLREYSATTKNNNVIDNHRCLKVEITMNWDT